MKLFKKRKEAKQEKSRALDNARYEVEHNFDAAIQKASQLVDPAVKILALRSIEYEIDAQIMREGSEISKKSENAKKISSRVSGSLWYGGVFTVLLVGGPPGWIAGGAALAGSAGSSIIGHRRKKTIRQNLELAAADHTANMEGQIDLVSLMTDVVVENNVEAISKSPLKDKVLALHGIADKFAEAGAKHVIAKKALEAEKAASPAADAAPRKLRINKKPGKL